MCVNLELNWLCMDYLLCCFVLFSFCYMCCVCTTAMLEKIVKAKIAFLNFSLLMAKMKLGVSVVIDDPDQLAAIRTR